MPANKTDFYITIIQSVGDRNIGPATAEHLLISMLPAFKLHYGRLHNLNHTATAYRMRIEYNNSISAMNLQRKVSYW